MTCSDAQGMDAFKLMKELRLNYEQEVHYLPKKTGLSLIESSVQVSTDPFLNISLSNIKIIIVNRHVLCSRVKAGSQPSAEMPKWRTCGA